MFLLGVLCLIAATAALPVLPDPPTLPDLVKFDSEYHTNIQNVATDSTPGEDKKHKIEVNNDNIKISLVVVPPPPELPPFDYSTLIKQKVEQKQKSDDSSKKEAEKSIEEKETPNIYIVKPVQIELPPNPASLPASVTAQDSVVIPPPPQLPPFDYSVLIKQKADQKHKSEYSSHQEAEKSKDQEKNEAINLEKEVQGEVLPSPTTLPDSVATVPVSEDHLNVLNAATNFVPMGDKKDNEEVKQNMAKVVLEVIPPPPELPSLDYTILEKNIYDQKEKSVNFMKQEAEKSKEEKDVKLLENTFEENIKEEPKLIEDSKLSEDSKPIEESKPVKESKAKEELKKEATKPSEHIPVIIQWTIPTAPFLSKLISKYPTLPSFGLDWPFQRPLMSRRPHIIYPKFDIDGIIHTN